MNETLAKLTPHLPLDEIGLDDALATAKAVKHRLEEHLPIDEISLDRAVSGAKSVKHNLEQRYRPAPKGHKARNGMVVVVLALVAGALVAMALRRRGDAPSAPAAVPSQPESADDTRVSAIRS